MKRERHTITGRLARIAALPALALAVSAQGQVPGSVQDYQLPSAPSPTPTAAGPVDSDHPVAAPTQPAPTPAPIPDPVIALPAPAAPTPVAEPGAASTPPSMRARAEREPAASPAATSSVPASPVPPPISPAVEPVPPSPDPTTAAPTVTPALGVAPWAWLAGGAALVLLLGVLWLWLWRRRRDAGEETIEDDTIEYETAIPLPAKVQPEARPPATLAPPRRDPAPAAPPPPEPRPLVMQLEARHLSRALVNATLAYRLTLTNRADTATGPLRIAGDIVSAHASLSAEEQLAPGESALEAIHEVGSLAPGESVLLSGELRLPLASILPIHSGPALVFVPLARFRAETRNGGATTRVFVVGQASDRPGGALRPFPLDRGPGVDRALGQHELEMPA